MTLPLASENGMVSPLANGQIIEQVKKSDACVFGPGLGKAPELWQTVKLLLEQKKPLLLDADGLNALKEHIDILKCVASEVVLTPHVGEMSRLCGLSAEEIQNNRQEVAVAFAKKWGVTLLLKGKDTVIASPDGEVHQNPTGNHGMASGGMGDVLSGVIGALLGYGLCGYHAATLGAFLHGLAGDMAAKDLGEFGMIAGDVLQRIPNAFMALQKP
jgi:NAD(P)H-hydrate epimerase